MKTTNMKTAMNLRHATITAMTTALMCCGVMAAQAGEHDHHQHHHAEAPANAQWEEAAVTVPDLSVVNQDGEQKRFLTDLVKGRIVAINFIYTSCTTVCSPATATLRQVQLGLQARWGDKVTLISVSVDPATDTPAVLKEYAGRYAAAPGWSFVTGRPADIKHLLHAFGVPVVKKEEHSPLIFVTNEPTGKWTRAYGLASADSIMGTIADVVGAATAETSSGTPAESHDHASHHQHPS